jgi:ABC-type nitrate/sulfonate/bicarbonate transport system permease component
MSSTSQVPGGFGEPSERLKSFPDHLGAVWRAVIGSIGGIALVLIALEVLARVEILPSRYFPPVSEMFWTLGQQFGADDYWTAIFRTLEGWFLGLVIATVVAVPVGLLLGFSDLLFHALRPIIEFLRPVPSVALIPLAILVYGAGMGSKVFLAAFASVWPLLIQTIYGARDINPMQLDTARAYRIRRADRIGRIIVPSAVPYIATGLRISSSVSLILVVTAELIIGAPGLGQDINVARSSGAIELMYALIITTGLLGWGLNVLFTLAERRALHWHPSQREAVR